MTRVINADARNGCGRLFRGEFIHNEYYIGLCCDIYCDWRYYLVTTSYFFELMNPEEGRKCPLIKILPRCDTNIYVCGCFSSLCFGGIPPGLSYIYPQLTFNLSSGLKSVLISAPRNTGKIQEHSRMFARKFPPLPPCTHRNFEIVRAIAAPRRRPRAPLPCPCDRPRDKMNCEADCVYAGG
jgi:hypothetical protein